MTIASHNTAISRKGASSPLLSLEKMGLINGKILDYGCGKGADERYLSSKSMSIDSYDPFWNPIDLKRNMYDTILCTYVLNVVEEKDEQELISNILKHLKKNGKAYLSVRRDIKKEGKTSRGYQRNVSLDYPVVKERKNNYCIYELSHA
tara:strand:+ start:20 stop:466 length:447 start_codon:yes stop_codon:yes gene_type:complete